MITLVTGSARTGRLIIPPENTSCTIRITGMMVMAAVVVWLRAEIQSDIMSAAYVIRKSETLNSGIKYRVIRPSCGYRTPTALIT